MRFDGITIEPEEISDLTGEPGSLPSGSVTLLNWFDKPTTITASGRVEGYRKTETKKLTPDDDTASIPLAFTSAIKAVRIRVEFSDQDYEKFTDAAVNVYDASGKAISQQGLNEPVLEFTVDNPEAGAESAGGKLEVRPAFAQPNCDASAKVAVRIDYLYKEPVDLKVERGGNPQVTLYPGIEAELRWSLEHEAPKPPSGMKTVGYIRAVERGAKQPVAEAEILEK